MDWNQYAKDIKQADANVQAVVKDGKIMTADIGFSKTMHQQSYDRLERTGAMIRASGSSLGNQVLAVYYVDKGHHNGAELHWITDNGVVIITNALRNGGLDICTKLNARPQQLKRYPNGGNPDWMVCEQVFPDKDWKIPNWLLNKASEHQRLGLNRMEESFVDSIKSGWKKIKDAFGDLPEVKLVGDDGREEVGYVHDYSKKNQTCDIYLKEKMLENAAIAAVASAVAASRNSGGGEARPKKKYVQQFHKGDEATLVGSQFGDEVPVTILDFTKCADLGIYSIKLEI